MDKMSVIVKKAYEHSLPKESIFSEEEKQKVRNRIASMQKDRPKKRLEFIPKALTVAAAAGFLLFMGGIVGKEISGDFSNETKENSVMQKHADSTDSFYAEVNVGEKVKGWELISKGAYDAGKTQQTGLMQAVFKGSAVLKGTITYYDESNPNHPNKILFLPDEASVKQLPIEEESFEKFYLDFQNQSTVEKDFELQPGQEKQNVMIEIDQYTVNFLKGTEVPDTVRFAFLVQENGKELMQEQRVKVDAAGHIELPNRLLVVYSDFSKTKEQKLLSGLSPFDIFQLYYYAENKQDFKTQFALYIDDAEYEAPFKSVKEYVAAKNLPEDQKGRNAILEIIKSAQLEEVVTSSNDAHIMISKDTGLGFGLIKNNKGFWKVKWMPLQ
jgi:hypothetical protein